MNNMNFQFNYFLKNILLCGDFISVQNILQNPQQTSLYHELILPAQERGGVVHLKKLLDTIIGKHSIITELVYVSKPTISNRISNIWSLFDENNKKYWRIKEVLGQVINKLDSEPMDIRDLREINTLKKHNTDMDNDKYIVVYDDQHFAAPNEKDIEDLIKLLKNDKCEKIYLKTSYSNDQRELIKNFLNPKVGISQKCTIILDSDSLNRSNISLNSSKSWEHLLDEIKDEKNKGFIQHGLSQVDRLFIYFKTAGVALIENKNPLPILYYDPQELDSTWTLKRTGITRGDLEILTVSIIYNDYLTKVLDNGTTYKQSDFVAIKKAIKAIRHKHFYGKGIFDQTSIENSWGYKDTYDKDFLNIFDDNLDEIIIENTDNLMIEPTNSIAINDMNEKAMLFSTATSNKNTFKKLKTSNHLSLLERIVGSSYERIIQKGVQIIENGYESELEAVPVLRIGEYVTYEQKEMEHINTIKYLFKAYVDKPSTENKPLAIAVFGPSGTGKSFIIQQLAVNISPNLEIVEFNLSQTDESDDLIFAIDRIRNIHIQNKIPIVIWDEFDCNNLHWLQFFLQPIQDGFFSFQGRQHYIGKAIFVFCGSSVSSFDEFIQLAHEERKKVNNETIINKSSDFISRIKAYLDITSLNPELKSKSILWKECYHDEFRHYTYIIRRAKVIRNLLERYWQKLIDPDTKKLKISLSIVQGLLRSNRFFYEARSIETILKISDIDDSYFFGISDLPSKHLLRPNVSPDFDDYVTSYKIENYLTEELIIKRHDIWFKEITKYCKDKKMEIVKGNKHFENDKIAIYPEYVEQYKDLNVQIKDKYNRTFSNFIANLSDLGFIFSIKNVDQPRNNEINEFLTSVLKVLDHDEWLDDQCKLGWVYKDGVVDENFLVSKYLEKFENLDSGYQRIYDVIIKELLTHFNENNFFLTPGYNLGVKIQIGFIGMNIDENSLLKILDLVKINFNYKSIEIVGCKKNEFHIKFSTCLSKIQPEKLKHFTIKSCLGQLEVCNDKCKAQCRNSFTGENCDKCNNQACCYVINTSNILIVDEDFLTALNKEIIVHDPQFVDLYNKIIVSPECIKTEGLNDCFVFAKTYDGNYVQMKLNMTPAELKE